MAFVYGKGPYGAGPYGRRSPAPVFVPEPPREPVAAAHLLGLGPWAANIQWRAAANYGLIPTSTAPSRPLLAIPGLTRASFTLRRTEASEAQVELDHARGDAMVIEEMVTDLWWRRFDPHRRVIEPIGRFQADTADVSFDEGRLSTAATFVDYRRVLGDRLLFAASPTGGHPAGSSVADLLYLILPENAGVDLAALTGANLGATNDPLEYSIGTPVADVIAALQLVSPPFDWDVELPAADADRPALRVWPGGRGDPRGVVLVDAGAGYTPIQSWRRRTNKADYANAVYLSGRNQSALAVTTDTELPTGQRDATTSEPDLITQSLVEAAARKVLAERSVRRASWEITLAPGFWEGRGHIDLGDPVRVVVRLGGDLLDETHPVEEIGGEVTANGDGPITLTLGWPRPSANPQSPRSTTGLIVRQLKKLGRR